MIDQFTEFIDLKCKGAKPLLICVRGSQAYGTAIPTSDWDYAGVYIQDQDDILGYGYKEQINDDKNDTVFYEIKRFLDLLKSNNPGILELLNTPDKFIIYKHPLFDEVLKNKELFLTKGCGKSFGGYAFQQLNKCQGQDKMLNWEKDAVTRKTPLDFCYIHQYENNIPLSKYLIDNELDQMYCGLSKLPHSVDSFSLFYDDVNKHFRGISFEDSNDIRLSSIPMHYQKNFIGFVSYNKDSYSSHCVKYKSYQTWLENRNTQRYVDVKNHNQKIDGKNLMHCVRLTEMSREIANGEGVKIFRENADYLLSIRRGELDLQTLIDKVTLDIKEIDELFKNSNLPESIDQNLINNLLIYIRKKFYSL